MSDKELFIVGLSHHTAPLDVREQLSVATAELASTLADLKAAGLAHCVVLSTCNRVEIHGTTAHPQEALEAARSFLASKSHAPIDDSLYGHTGAEAVAYGFRVAASLDSMVVGEPQILGQVKTAVAESQRLGHLDPLLQNYFQRAFANAKRVRSETGIAEGLVSISSVAVDLTKQIFGDLAGKRALLIGAGEMAEAAATSLTKHGATLTVVNRSPERAERLAELCGGIQRPASEIPHLLTKVDVCITSTSSPEPILRYEQMQQIARQRRGKPLFLVDIAVPRDIEHRVSKLSNVYLYDVDDLSAVASENQRLREAAAEEAFILVEHAASEFLRWKENLSLAPTVVALRQGFQQIVADEIERTKSKLGPGQKDEHELLDALAHRLVNKLLHAPLTQLKSPGPNQDSLVLAVQHLFALEIGEKTPSKRTPQSTNASAEAAGDDALPAGSAPEGNV